MITPDDFSRLKTIGIVAHSYEGGALCFLTACREGGVLLGTHMHPSIVLSAIPMGLSMPGWQTDDYSEVSKYLAAGVDHVTKAGADFFICPDNTAHLVLEKFISKLPIPGLHIAEVVGHEIVSNGWKRIGLLGTQWTMTGTVYANVLEARRLVKIIPDEPVRTKINNAIFNELCLGIFRQETINLFVNTIADFKTKGAECVILGCTEIPLIITEDNSPLPVLDSTRLLAQYAVNFALSDTTIHGPGWIDPV